MFGSHAWLYARCVESIHPFSTVMHISGQALRYSFSLLTSHVATSVVDGLS